MSNTNIPICTVRAITFLGTKLAMVKHLHDPMAHLDYEEISGSMRDTLQQALNFFRRNLHHVQAGQSVNSLGVLEIPHIVFKELLTKALVHSTHSTTSTIRLLIFRDIIEITIPEYLPDNLPREEFKLGSGIMRALAAYPDIEFVDDRENNLFKAIIKRPPFPG